MTDNQILDELSKASEGLLYMSESDYPLVPFLWDGSQELTAEYLYQVAEKPADSPILRLDPIAFLGGAYAKVGTVMRAHLSNLRGYKVGSVNMPVYLVGRSPAGNWLGVSTRVVET